MGSWGPKYGVKICHRTKPFVAAKKLKTRFLEYLRPGAEKFSYTAQCFRWVEV